MLTLLKIKNIALIDELAIEFGDGLNLLTGETGSGKSIIVDSLDALTGNRVSGDLIKQGEDSARIEGLFWVDASKELLSLLDESGIEIESSEAVELIIRRALALRQEPGLRQQPTRHPRFPQRPRPDACRHPRPGRTGVALRHRDAHRDARRLCGRR
ncbi:MAG: AAA family ATPase [Acidobacteria bacterium]|nr:AAA family ATPase [Acidobacteriota bacterium]